MIALVVIVGVVCGVEVAEIAKLAGANRASGDNGGFSVATRGDWAIYGARYHDTEGQTWAGSVYVFKQTGGVWAEHSALAPPGGVPAYEIFGESVNTDGARIIVGATRGDIGTLNDGAAYVWVLQGDTWVYEGALSASDSGATAGEDDSFGDSVAVDGEVCVRLFSAACV